MSATVAAALPRERRTIVIRGEMTRLRSLLNTEMCAEGAAGTGKTRAILEWIHRCLREYPGSTALVARKTHVDLAGSAMQTYQREVLQPYQNVRYFGGNRIEPPAFIYPNGSRLLMSGLDKAEKVKSKAFNIAFINEATECTPEDAELVRSRLGRDERMPFWQLIYDANPGAPTHWLNQRMNAGLTARMPTTHRDNPAFWDAARQEWTPIGRRYVEETLAGLTGVRRLRLLLGLWAAAEGMVYEDAWEPSRNLANRDTVCIGTTSLYGNCGIPTAWPRFMSIDFGYTNPFVCQWWALDPDDRLILYREIYHTRRLVSEHCADILKYAGWKREGGVLKMARPDADPLPRQVFGDPAGGEAKQQIYQQTGLRVTDANNDVKAGIDATAARMKAAGDGRPRLVILRDSRVEVDTTLRDRKKPTCTAEEVETYAWDTRNGVAARKEQPVKEDDHGVDAMRYVCASRDLRQLVLAKGPRIW